MNPRVLPSSIVTRLVLRHVDTQLSGDDGAKKVDELDSTGGIAYFSRRRPVRAIVRLHSIPQQPPIFGGDDNDTSQRDRDWDTEGEGVRVYAYRIAKNDSVTFTMDAFQLYLLVPLC